MILATPLAAAGFATAAVLTAVYCFRRKSPPKTVGSLLLWPKPAVSLSAARRRDRLRTPPSFWLELFILLALVCAALTPLTWRQSSGSLTVILDTSPSMSAGDAGKKAAEFLEREKKRGAKDAIRVRKAKDVRALERELASARAIQLPGDEILVLTCRPYVLGGDCIVFIVDVSNYLFDDILECDQTCRPAVFINDDGDVGLFGLHPIEQDRCLERLCHIGYRLYDLLDIFDGLDILVVEVLVVDDADDIVEVIHIHRKS